MLSAYIVEDEPLARVRLQKMLRQYANQIEVLGEADYGALAIQEIEKLQPAVLFLDIQLPDMTGFEVLNQLTYQPLVIFATAYEQYAMQAFDSYSVDYLVKPFRIERLKKTMDKLLKFGQQLPSMEYGQLEKLIPPVSSPTPPFSFPIKLGDRILLIDYEDISHLKAEDKYIRVFTNKGKSYLSDGSLGQLIETLPVSFMRVHRSYIVNRSRIKEVRKFFKGKLILVLNDSKQTTITTGETYSSKVRTSLGL